MDYIDGCTLFELWDSLYEKRKRNIINALEGYEYVQELRSIRLPDSLIPGPSIPTEFPSNAWAPSSPKLTPGLSPPTHRWSPGSTASALACERTYNHMWFGGMIAMFPKLDATHPLVLCHMDLHPRNILVDKAGMLWLI